ncbi:hypothetical protein WN943_014008 [Citrus x changshan-huyou]
MELISATINDFGDSRNIPPEVCLLRHQLSSLARHERIMKLKLWKYASNFQCDTINNGYVVVQKAIFKHARFKRKIMIIHNRYKHDLKRRIILMLQIVNFYTKFMKLDNIRSDNKLLHSNVGNFLQSPGKAGYDNSKTSLHINPKSQTNKGNRLLHTGRVQIPFMKETPLLRKYLLGADSGLKGSKFKKNIRAYNSMFAFTSMGGRVDASINRSKGPYVFRMSVLEVAGLTVGDFSEANFQRYVIIEHRTKELRRITYLHPSFMPMTYPLIYPYGEDGYRPDISLRDITDSPFNRQKLTMRQYYCFRLQQRLNEGHTLLQAGRLFQQYIVDCYMAIKEERFRWIWNNQQKLISDIFSGLMDVVHRGDSDCSKVGKSIILPSSHMGGPRYRIQNYQDVNKFMIHGPCGKHNSHSPCMMQDKCTKHFPKKFNDQTTVDTNGFPVYKRRNTGIHVEKKGVFLDNRYVVPYHRNLIVKFDAHINVEICNYSRSVKYLFKYVHKGSDRTTATMESIDTTQEMDEIKTYLDCRYISATEACWRIFQFDIHYRKPAVERLPFHLPGEHTVIFEESKCLENVLTIPGIEKIKFTEWLEANKNYDDARELTYSDFPTCNRLVNEELDYDRDQLKKLHEKSFTTLNACQKSAYEAIMHFVDNEEGRLFFINRHGGTGKTFLWNTIIAKLRSHSKIVLPVATSGIAALLLPNGRTAHSRFHIPLDVTVESTCEIRQGTLLAGLLMKTSLIIWDEEPMAHKFCFEALDRTLRDILRTRYENNYIKPFGGLTIVCGGDFRQILPVVPKGTRADIVDASLNSSYLWPFFKIYELKQNMRLYNGSVSGSEAAKIASFDKWLLQIGNGSLYDDIDRDLVKLPSDICKKPSENLMKSIVDTIYPSIQHNYSDPAYLKERAILTPKNEMVHELNEMIMNIIPGQWRTYFSSDSICKASANTNDEDVLYLTEFLNSLKFNGIPNHDIRLKEGAPVMLLRNLNQIKGLCNGTRLIVTRLGKWFIRGDIISGTNIGQNVTIPRIIMSHNESRWPFNLNR